MRGWMLAGVRRGPGPLIGTVVASAAAAALTVAALSVAVADTATPAGRLADASVVVAGDTSLHVTVGQGEDARQSLPLSAYRASCPAWPRRPASRASPPGWSGPVTWPWSR